MDLETATLAALQVEFIRLAGVVAQASDARQEILAVMNRRRAEAIARERLNSLSVVQKDALMTVLTEEKLEVVR